MHVCFLCTEIFLWGKHGGFGRATRFIGRELAKRGVRVSAIVPLPRGAQHDTIQEIDGMTVYAYPPTKTWDSQSLYRRCDADIYHTEEPFFGTYLARRTMPHKTHIVTCRDPRLWQDWLIEFVYPNRTRRRLITTALYYDNFLVKQAVKQADIIGCAARFLIPTVQRKYRLKSAPMFLPSPVLVPQQIHKAATPTVCFVGRLDRRKRPEVFFQLVRHFPDIKFIVAGASQDDRFAEDLRQYTNLPNLELTGFIDQFNSSRLSEILEASWILVNTSEREGLPTSFIEACAHRCALLSKLNPENFTSNFGHVVEDGDFVSGLKYLLEHERWEQQGLKGYEYVKDTFENEKVIDQHLAMYHKALLKGRNTSSALLTPEESGEKS